MAAANAPDLVAIQAGLRRLQLYLLEKVANAQACNLALVVVPVAEMAEYAKAVTNAIVELGTASTPNTTSAAADTQSQLNVAMQKIIQEAVSRVQPAAAPSSPAAPPAAPGTAKS